MKRILIIPLFAISLSLFSQEKFILKPEGFVNASDESKSYVICDIPGKTQEVLYKSFLNYLFSQYISPERTINQNPFESLNITASEKDVINMKGILGTSTMFDINYTLNVQFKDGKVRILSPRINKVYKKANDESTVFLINGKAPYDTERINLIFNKKGKVIIPSSKESLEKYFDDLIATMVHESIEMNDNW